MKHLGHARTIMTIIICALFIALFHQASPNPEQLRADVLQSTTQVALVQE